MDRLEVPPELNRNAPDVRRYAPELTGSVLIQHAAERLGRADFATSDVLDIGCGVRFAQAIINTPIPIKTYTGIDVDRPLIAFLRRAVHDERFAFAHWDAHNGRYHEAGRPIARESAFPIEGRFDVIWLFSVFTHMTPHDVDAVLAIARRHARRNGQLFFTAFVDDDVERFEERIPHQPLARPTYGEAYLRTLCTENGWLVDSVMAPCEERFVQTSFACYALTDDNF